MMRLKIPTPLINKNVSRIERGNIVEMRCGQIFSLGVKLIITIDISGKRTRTMIGKTNKTHPQLEGRFAGGTSIAGAKAEFLKSIEGSEFLVVIMCKSFLTAELAI